jgi:hypothetical protein
MLTPLTSPNSSADDVICHNVSRWKERENSENQWIDSIENLQNPLRQLGQIQKGAAFHHLVLFVWHFPYLQSWQPGSTHGPRLIAQVTIEENIILRLLRVHVRFKYHEIFCDESLVVGLTVLPQHTDEKLSIGLEVQCQVACTWWVGSARYQGCWYTHLLGLRSLPWETQHSNQEMAHCETCRLPGWLGSEAPWHHVGNSASANIRWQWTRIVARNTLVGSGHQSEIQPRNNWWQGDCGPPWTNKCDGFLTNTTHVKTSSKSCCVTLCSHPEWLQTTNNTGIYWIDSIDSWRNKMNFLL